MSEHSTGTRDEIRRRVTRPAARMLSPVAALTRWGEMRDPRLEAEFRAYRYENELKLTLRVSAWAAFLVFLLFGVLDYLVVWDVAEIALTIRYAVVVPIALALGLLTLTRHASRFLWVIGMVHSLMGPALFLTVGELAVDPGGLLYTLWGAILFPILVPQLTRLGVRWSLVVAAITLVYLIALDVLVTPRMPYELIFIVLLYLTGCGFGAWAMYQAEVAGRQSFWAERIIAWQMEELAIERDKSERLLLNVLPESIAERLRETSDTIADRFDEVTVLFADIAGFTSYSARVSPEQLVSRLDEIFSRFDDIADDLGLEKIKTIGDAYMVAAGLPHAHDDGPAAVAQMALRMREAVLEVNEASGEAFAVRIGMHTGPAVAGVIGRRKFIYDLWGDTVNIASRMESHSEVGEIQVSEATAARLEERFELEERGVVELKGKGAMRTFWLRGQAG